MCTTRRVQETHPLPRSLLLVSAPGENPGRGFIILRLKVPFKPHSNQAAFINSTAKFAALFTGIGYGKTAAGAIKFIQMVGEHPGVLFVVVTPTSKMMRLATFPEIMHWLPREIISFHKKADQVVGLRGGGRFAYLSADNERHVDRLRGMEIGGGWADEVPLFPHLFWKVIIGRLRAKGGPLTFHVTSTPKGWSWPHSYWVKKISPDTKEPLLKPEDYVWWGGSSHDNPHTPQEYKDTLEASYSGRFKNQEIYGKFEGFEGSVYPNFNPGVHMINTKIVKDKKGLISVDVNGLKVQMKQFLYCGDWGFTNEMAFAILGLDSDNRWYILEEFYKKRQQVEDIIVWLQKKQEFYGHYFGYADPANPEHILKLNRKGLRCRQGKNAIMPGVEAVSGALALQKDGRPRLYVVHSCTNTIDEFQSYRFREQRKEDRSVDEDKFEGADHLMDAIRYGVFTHRAGGTGFAVLGDPKKKFLGRSRGL